MRFAIGTTFKTRGKAQKTCTVVDYYITRNMSGEVVKTRYIAEHEFMGQTLRDEYVETSIAMGLVKEALTPKQKEVLSICIRHHDYETGFGPTLREIAEDTRLDINTIKGVLGTLVQAGKITVDEGGMPGVPTCYTCNDMEMH
jgi:hypothetical protein